MFIDKYKIFIFDLDGTIIDSEHIHHKSYNLQLKDKITFETYCDIFHSINKDIFCNLHKIDYIKKEKENDNKQETKVDIITPIPIQNSDKIILKQLPESFNFRKKQNIKDNIKNIILY